MLATILILALGLLAAWHPGAARAQGGPPERLNIHYINTSGQVGHHMVAEPRAKCGANWDADVPVVMKGSLPPGLRLSEANIEGTPQQPGRWLVTLLFRQAQCRGRSYGDISVHIEFNIKGTAPRRLN